MKSGQIPVEWLPQYTYADYESWEGDWELLYGIPYSMSPSPKRVHQATGKAFVLLAQEALNQQCSKGDCELYYELDWIVDDTTVVRPDVMIVCGSFSEDFLRFPPTLILEITSKSTQIADRNIKFKLYESQQVPFYLIADPERQTVDIFKWHEGHYHSTEQASFRLGENCDVKMDLDKLWK